MRPLGAINVVRVLNILLVGKQLQILKPVIASVKVYVIDFKSAQNWAVKRFPHKPMHAFFVWFSVYAQICNEVKSSVCSRLYQSVRNVPRPRFAVFNSRRSGYTDTQKFGDVFKRFAINKHLFSGGNFVGGKRFTPRDTSYIALVANFVVCFKSEYRFPRFHSYAPNLFLGSNTMFVRGQA